MKTNTLVAHVSTSNVFYLIIATINYDYNAALAFKDCTN